jgi:hypothetical protein
MINAQIHTLREPDGSPVANVAFDLSAEQLAAASHALVEVLHDRHRHDALETDDVLALRELTAVRDEFERLTSAGGHATLVMTLARLIVLHDALDEYVAAHAERDWRRDADSEALPLLEALLGPLAALRADALDEALRAATPLT